MVIHKPCNKPHPPKPALAAVPDPHAHLYLYPCFHFYDDLFRNMEDEGGTDMVGTVASDRRASFLDQVRDHRHDGAGDDGCGAEDYEVAVDEVVAKDGDLVVVGLWAEGRRLDFVPPA